MAYVLTAAVLSAVTAISACIVVRAMPPKVDERFKRWLQKQPNQQPTALRTGLGSGLAAPTIKNSRQR